MDPLTGAVCNPDEIWQMVDEMLVAQAEWLPQYQDEIPAAKARLAEAEANGTRVKLIRTEGAARLKIKTIDEIAQDKIAAQDGYHRRQGQPRQAEGLVGFCTRAEMKC